MTLTKRINGMPKAFPLECMVRDRKKSMIDKKIPFKRRINEIEEKIRDINFKNPNDYALYHFYVSAINQEYKIYHRRYAKKYKGFEWSKNHFQFLLDTICAIWVAYYLFKIYQILIPVLLNGLIMY